MNLVIFFKAENSSGSWELPGSALLEKWKEMQIISQESLASFFGSTYFP